MWQTVKTYLEVLTWSFASKAVVDPATLGRAYHSGHQQTLRVSRLIKIPLSDQPFRQICPPRNLFRLSISLAACINSLLIAAPLLRCRSGACFPMVLLLSSTVRGASSSLSSGLAPPSPALPKDWRQQDTDMSSKKRLAMPQLHPPDSFAIIMASGLSLGCPHRGSSLAWGLVGPLDWGRAPLGPHMCFDRRAHLVAAQGELTAHRSPPPTGPRGEVARMPVLVVATQCVPHMPKHPTGHLRPPNACHRQDTGSYSLTGFCAWFLFYTAHD